MRKGLIDKISLSLLILLVLTVGYIVIEWANNAFQTHKHWVYSVDVNDDGLVASASENQIFLWDKRNCIDIFIGHTDAIKSISFSHDNQFMVSGSIDKTAQVWSTGGHQTIYTLKGHTAGVNTVKFGLSDKYIVSAGYDDKLFIWDWRNQIILKEFDTKHTEFDISKSDILAFVDTTCNLNLVDLDSLSLTKTVGPYCGAPVFHPGGKILAVRASDGEIQFIDSYSGELHSTMDIKHGTHYGPLAFTPDGNHIVAGIWGGDIEIWDWQQKKLVRALNGTSGNSINEFVFNNKNQLLSASGDRSVKTWDLPSGALKSSVGDGLYRKQLLGVLAVLSLMTLLAGFLGVSESSVNRYSRWGVISILSVWTFGIFIFGYLVKSNLRRYSMAITWTLTVISGLALLSFYYSWLTFYVVPFALFFGLVKLELNRDDKSIMIPIVMNLVLCGVMTYFVVLSGIQR